ncbi:MAG: IS630 family transposase [Oscillatoria sp. SIO1A7]|nr:IS630 family transposase [Oscillatoria sp. SIO1A7]
MLIRDINVLSAKLLKRIYRSLRHHQVRQRAHCLILINQGAKIKELQQIFKVSYKTIYNWINRWESEGVLGLYNKKGRGRKQTFNLEQKKQIKLWVKEGPRQLKQTAQKIENKWGLKTSTQTIKRVLKEMKMTWHRMRRSVFGKPPSQEYEDKKAQLKEFKKQDKLGKINLYYLDETGFTLIPSVPYGWQEIGEYVEIPSRRSNRLNVLGIMGRNNYLQAYISNQSINSDVVVACIDAFFPNKSEVPTIIVMERASIHNSNAIYEKLEEWGERNITLFELPTYSPHLNLIEILWRKIKYEWLPIDAYCTWEIFVDAIETILREFGETYVINFD